MQLFHSILEQDSPLAPLTAGHFGYKLNGCWVTLAVTNRW